MHFVDRHREKIRQSPMSSRLLWACLLLVVLLVKKVFPRPFAMAALSMVLAGAVGNLIDRALLCRSRPARRHMI